MASAVSSAFAAPPSISVKAASGDNQETTSGVFGFLDGIDRSNTLLGDMWGLRTQLAKAGITLAVQETSETMGNRTGGINKSFEYDGLTQVVMQLDTRRAFNHYGGLLNVSLLNIHGQNMSQDNLGTLQTASGIEADRATRLWEAWYDQKFLDEDRLDVKVGQQSLDQEFMVSSNASYFVNTMFGWPMVPSADMPAGGPAYPLSAIGARISARPVNGTTILAGVFNGSPVKRDNGTDPQMQNRHGTSFPLGEGYLAIAEVQFSYPALGAMVEPGETPALGWTYRIGGWYSNRQFSDLRFDENHVSLADPASTGNPALHKGDYAWYMSADRLVWRDSKDPNRTIAVFGRLMGTPQKDRNPVDLSANLGVVFHSPFRYRADDIFGIGIGYAHVSSAAASLDRDNFAFGNTTVPIFRSSEKFIELTYQYQVKPWLQLQPDIQYVWNPGAGIPNPANPNGRIKNELVVGLRTNIFF